LQVSEEVERVAGQLRRLTGDLAAAYVSNNSLSRDNLPKLIEDVYRALKAIASPVTEVPRTLEPAVPIRRSVTPDYLISLEDGRKVKSLKRHLRELGISPAEYRRKWGLPDDYPMVAKNYSADRARIARETGLGRKWELPVAARRPSVFGA
jgi:predicted transcriptional regulator